MSKKRLNQSLEVHRIAVAARDISCAQDGFENILELNAQLGDKLYQSLLFGAVTSYCRPFTNNDGFGNMASKWKKFAGNEVLAETHSQMIDYRNKVVAHSDISSNELTIYPVGGTLIAGEQRHILDEPMFGVSTPLLSIENVRSAVTLCKYQESRMNEYLIKEIGTRFSEPLNGGYPFKFNHLEM
ncbi:hypothetical protein [Vibrio kanaloae]|uniref:hypothetical protein n=1 Tax=Vibrio kanaloae TaxID=170673 RepID=UPI0012466DE3|nr:hypothetical protein [Vibrio kanaloae]KAB0458330.1 hypothetical protein F7Q89_20265 [Vibrio kanaloae]